MSKQTTSQHHRAGRYIAQLTGYKAFIPNRLPPDPPVRLEGKLQALLSQADIALGRLDGSIQTLPDANLFISMYTRKEAVLSSQIEGTQSSLSDLLVAEAGIPYARGAIPKDVNEVLNYVNAMEYGLERLEKLPLSIRLIKEIHAILLSGVRGRHLQPGELRSSQNWIGSPGCSLNEAMFVPPPPDEMLTALGDLEKFMHVEDTLPALIRIGLVHAQFETIHPFLDGNGRVGRLLITFLLCQREILLKPALYLSYYFKQHRDEYYRRLQSVRNEGDWESWLAFFIQGVVEVSGGATDTARRILTLREDHRELVTDKLGRAANHGHRVLERVFRHPYIRVTEVQEMMGTSYAPANSIVERLVDIGILNESTGNKRNRVFRYASYLKILGEGTNLIPGGSEGANNPML